ncbi:hypothetical protein PFISCL1PPCAC_27476, partial [Pristionchus fissidentatus]
ILLLVFIGFFGNVAFISTVLSRRKCRSSRALLLCILCSLHCVMLTHFFMNVLRTFNGTKLTKQECIFALTIPPTMYAVSHQAMLYLLLGFDLLISLIDPAKHHQIRTIPYVVALQVP